MSLSEQVKILGSKRSPYSCRVEIALKLKGVQYEFIQEDLSNKSDDLLKYNPVHKKVPVLLHNGKAIAESGIILEYIDETFKGPLILPKDPYEKANALMKCYSLRPEMNLFNSIKSALWGGNAEEEEKAAEEAIELLKVLESQLTGKKFFGGDEIGLVDIVGNFIGYWLGIFEDVIEKKLFTKEKFPRLCEWMDNFTNCTPVKECLPPRDLLFEGLRARFKKA